MFQVNQHDLARTQLRESLCLEEDTRVVISTGACVESDGILDFLEAAKLLPEVIFLWYGETAAWRVKRKIKRAMREATENVCFMGGVDQEEFRQACLGTDLFLGLSRDGEEESAVMEVLACGTPAMVRDIPVYRFRLRERENVYRVKDVEEAVSCVKERMKERGTEKMMGEKQRMG
ncbi:MAG: glycosyltransferase [Lachnospiraceae bacterium]|nr:glycosyltransferase [Lachnospiraceae bacterium]